MSSYFLGQRAALEKLGVSSGWIRSIMNRAKPTLQRAEAFEQNMADAAQRLSGVKAQIPRYSGPYNLSTDIPRTNRLADLISTRQDAADHAYRKWINPDWDL